MAVISVAAGEIPVAGNLSQKLTWELANPRWASTLNPVLSIPFLSGLQIENIILKAAVPKAINHLLQRMQQGWFLTDNSADSRVWRTKAFNDLTLTLEANADTTVSIWVF